MEYVYLLTNKHVTHLVKFGFTTRSPSHRAAELSAGTGIPGKWKVHHYWEVMDGHAVEQEVFRHLRRFREGKEEYLRLSAETASSRISDIVAQVGIDPAAEAAKKKAERERIAWKIQLERNERAAREKAKQDAIYRISSRISAEIHDAQATVRTAMEGRSRVSFKTMFIVAFVIGLFIRGGNVSAGAAIGTALMVSVVLSPFMLMAKTYFNDDTKYKKELDSIEKSILRKYGLKSATDQVGLEALKDRLEADVLVTRPQTETPIEEPKTDSLLPQPAWGNIEGYWARMDPSSSSTELPVATQISSTTLTTVDVGTNVPAKSEASDKSNRWVFDISTKSIRDLRNVVSYPSSDFEKVSSPIPGYYCPSRRIWLQKTEVENCEDLDKSLRTSPY